MKNLCVFPISALIFVTTLVVPQVVQAQLPTDSGSCIEFDGESWLQPESPFELNLPQGFTIEAWVHPSAGIGERMTLIGKHENFVLWRTPGGGLASSFGGESQTGLVPDEFWTHVAVTWDTSWVRLYVNAKEVASAFRIGHITESDIFFRIGAGNPPSEETFRGYMDEVRIWYGPRKPAEIRATMGVPLTGDEPTLFAYWPLDDFGSPIAADSSGHLRDLYLGYLGEEDFADPDWSENPIGLFGGVPASEGTVLVKEGVLPCNGILSFEVRDLDLTGGIASATLEASLSGDIEAATLIESSSGSARFPGQIQIETGTAMFNDGVLQVGELEEILIQYLDEDDGTGASEMLSATAETDCQLPDWTPTFTSTSTQTPTATLTPTITPTPNPDPKIYFVADDQPLSGDGLTWETAFKTIGKAVDVAVGGDEVWIKSGTYEERIYLDQAVSLYGGFSGNENSLNERIKGTSTTIQGDHVELARFAESRDDEMLEINNEMVVEISDATGVYLDRFIVKGGISSDGGGFSITHSTVSISNCTVEYNAVKGHGGGLFAYDSHLSLFRVIVRDNKNVLSSGGVDPQGAGLFAQDCRLIVDRCLFEGNECPDYGAGGGVFLLQCVLDMDASFVVHNRMINNYDTHGSDSGGIFIGDRSNAHISNTIVGFNSSQYGSALVCDESSRLNLVHSIIARNYNQQRPRHYYYPFLIRRDPKDLRTGSQVFVRNSIVEEIGGNPDVDYSVVRNWPSGQNNRRGPVSDFVPSYDIDLTDLSLEVTDYSFLSAPSLVDSGTTVALSKDIRGKPRPVDIPGVGSEGMGYDIGLLEFGQDELVGVTIPPTPTSTRFPNPTDTPTPMQTPTCADLPTGNYPATFTPIPYQPAATPTPTSGFERIAYVVTNPRTSTWPNPYLSLRDAVESSGANRIMVQKGVYDMRGINLIDQILYGGLEGNEDISDLDQRDFESNETVLIGGFGNRGGTLDGVTVTGEAGVSCSNDCGILNCRFVGINRLDYREDLRGGALKIGKGTLRVDNCYFGYNLANRGAGIHAEESKLVVANSVFEHNQARWYTSLFCHSWCDEVYNEGEGGAIWGYRSEVDFIGCEFRGNTAMGGKGGAVHMWSSMGSIIGCRFEENTSHRESGNAIFLDGGEYFVRSCEFLRNGDLETSGSGAVYLWGPSGRFDNCYFVENYGEESGAIHFEYGGPTFFNCFFVGNSSANAGRASAIGSNRSGSSYPGIDLVNCTLVDHTANPIDHGSVIAAQVRIYNSILWNPIDEFSSGGDVEVYDSIVEELVDFANSENVHTTYPGFADYCAGDFHLAEGAFAIDRGNNAYVPEDLHTDFIGGPRVLGTSVDIGAVEFQSVAYNTPTFTRTFTPTPTLTPTITPTFTLTPTMLFDVATDGHIDSRDLLKLIVDGTLKSGNDSTESAFHFSVYWKRSR